MCEIQGSHGGVEDGSFETPASTHPTTQHHIWKWGIFYPTHIQHYQDSSHILVSSLFLKISNVYWRLQTLTPSEHGARRNISFGA